jgi:hypothetical protein
MFSQLAPGANEMPQYEFLTNHAHVLLCVAHDPGIRLRDIAQTVGITERPLREKRGPRFVSHYQWRIVERSRLPDRPEQEIGHLF